MSVDIIVKCFEMAVPWYFIASDTHQFSIHFVYHFYCLPIHIFILIPNVLALWVGVYVCASLLLISDLVNWIESIAKSLNIQHFQDMELNYLDFKLA